MPISQLLSACVLFILAFRNDGFLGIALVLSGIVLSETITILRRYRGISLPTNVWRRGLGDHIYIWLGKPLYNATLPKKEKPTLFATFLINHGMSKTRVIRLYHFFWSIFGYSYNWQCTKCNLKIASTDYRELNRIQLAHILHEKEKEQHDVGTGF